MNQIYPGRDGSVAWTARSPYLTPVTLYLCGTVESLVHDETTLKTHKQLMNEIIGIFDKPSEELTTE